jgi:hypothetical protein
MTEQIQKNEFEEFEKIKEEYIVAKAFHDTILKERQKMMEKWERLFEEGKITLDEISKIDMEVDDKLGYWESFDILIKAEDKLIDFGSKLFIKVIKERKIAKTQEDIEKIEYVFKEGVKSYPIREEIIEILLTWDYEH